MRTTVTARHCVIDDEIKARATEIVARLAKLAHRPQRATVVFDADHGRKVVELMVYLPRGHTHVATAEATEFRTALDQAAAKMRHQLDKGGVPRTARRVPSK